MRRTAIAVIPTCAWPKLKHLCVQSFGSRALDRSERCGTSRLRNFFFSIHRVWSSVR